MFVSERHRLCSALNMVYCDIKTPFLLGLIEACLPKACSNVGPRFATSEYSYFKHYFKVKFEV